MTPSSQELEPPGNPGRFSNYLCDLSTELQDEIIERTDQIVHILPDG